MQHMTQCWTRVADLYEAIRTHPFNTELAAGTLSKERFVYYVQQDALYLRDYTRALTLLAAKAEDAACAQDLLAYARDGVEVEHELHRMMSQTFAIPPATRQEPACFAYTQFLLAQTALNSYAVGLAAILPCFWIYREVGLDIARRTVAENRYAPWIDTYTDPGFLAVTDRMIEITEQAAVENADAVRQAMARAFVQSTQCEWAFWDAAYGLTRWPAV